MTKKFLRKMMISGKNKLIKKNLLYLYITIDMSVHENNICSPYGNKNKIKNGTCLPNKVLKTLKKKVKRKNNTKKSTGGVNELKINLKKKCKDEVCWIDHLVEDENEKNKIKKKYFRPLTPSKWKQDPNTWLTDDDISKVLKQYEVTYPEFLFLGPSPIDFDTVINKSCVFNTLCNFNLKKLIEEKKTQIGIVFNLDFHTGPGTHWVSLYIDIKNKFIFYFDSNGEKTPKQIKALIKKVILQGKKENINFVLYENNTTEHQRTNTECGMYSLFFIITMLTKKILNKKKTPKNVIKYFLGRLTGRIKDNLVSDLRDFYFRN